jgi:hypothetical protein
MGLQKNVVDLVIAGGQDEHADPRLAVRPLQLQNTRYAFEGSLSKRYGSQCLTPKADAQNNRVGETRVREGNVTRKTWGAESGTPCTLVSSKGELLRCSRGAIDRVLPVAFQKPGVAASTYAYGPLQAIDTLPNHHVSQGGVAGVADAPASAAAYGGYLASLSQVAGVLTLVIRDAATNAVLSDTKLRQTFPVTSEANVAARVVVAPDFASGHVFAYVYYRDLANPFELWCAPYNCTLSQEVIPGLVVANVLQFDVTPPVFNGLGSGLDTSFLAWIDSNLGTDQIRVAWVRGTTKGPTTSFGGSLHPTAIGVDAAPGGARVHVGAGETNQIKGFAFTAAATPVLVWGSATLNGAHPVGAVLNGGIAPRSIGPTGSECGWLYTLRNYPPSTGGSPSGQYIALAWAGTSATGTVSNFTTRIPNATLVTKAWADAAGALYAVVAFTAPPSDALLTTYGIARVAPFADATGAGGSHASGECDAFFSPLLATDPTPVTLSLGDVAEYMAPDRTAEGGTVKVASALLPRGRFVDPRITTQWPIAFYKFSPVSSYGACEILEDYLLSAGAVVSYDGDRCFEVAPGIRPTQPLFKDTPVAPSGGLVTGARYGFLYCFATTDARGVVHRSGPSDPTFYTPTLSGANRVDFYADDRNVPPSRLFNDTSDAPNIRYTLELYRTEANGATFYLEQAGPCLSAFSAGELTDTELRTQPVLYTTGGALEHACPPPARYAALGLGRVFLLGTEDDYVWPSGALLQGEAPWWNAVTSFPVPGLGVITGGAELDQSMIVFRESSIYAISGDGPADTGDGAFAVQAVSTDVGCIDARSIVRVPDGLLFLSHDGIAILTRALAVVRVGKGVEDFLEGATPEETVGLSSAVNIPTETEVRFSVHRYTGTPEPEAACCYRDHGMEDPSWSETVWSSHGVPGGMRIASACLHENLYTWITTNGYVFQSTTTDWKDSFTTGSTPAYVPMTAWLAPWKPGPTQAWSRIWRVGLLAELKGAHDLAVDLFHDYGPTPVTTHAWTAVDLAALPNEQLKVHVVRQKAEAIGVRVRDTTPTGVAVGTGEGLVIAGVSLEVGIKPGMHRRPADQKR